MLGEASIRRVKIPLEKQKGLCGWKKASGTGPTCSIIRGWHGQRGCPLSQRGWVRRWNHLWWPGGVWCHPIRCWWHRGVAGSCRGAGIRAGTGASCWGNNGKCCNCPKAAPLSPCPHPKAAELGDFTPRGEFGGTTGMLCFPQAGAVVFAVAAPKPVPVLLLTPLGRARRVRCRWQLRAGGFLGKSWISCGKTQQGHSSAGK